MRLHCPRIHQQSREGTRGRRCAGLCLLSQKLDYSSHPTKLGHWNSSHQCGVRPTGPDLKADDDEWIRSLTEAQEVTTDVPEDRVGFSPSTRQQQRGNIETCLMLNKKGSRQCRRIEAQCKETPTAPGVQLGLRDGGSRDARKHSRAASGRQPPMDWRGRSIRRTAIASRPRNQSARKSQLPAWRPGEAYRSRRPAERVAEKRRLGRPVVHG